MAIDVRRPLKKFVHCQPFTLVNSLRTAGDTCGTSFELAVRRNASQWATFVTVWVKGGYFEEPHSRFPVTDTAIV